MQISIDNFYGFYLENWKEETWMPPWMFCIINIFTIAFRGAPLSLLLSNPITAFYDKHIFNFEADERKKGETVKWNRERIYGKFTNFFLLWFELFNCVFVKFSHGNFFLLFKNPLWKLQKEKSSKKTFSIFLFI